MLWQTLHYFDIHLYMAYPSITLPRERDQVLMEIFSVYGSQPGDNSKSEPVPGITGVHILIGHNYCQRPLPGGFRFQPRRQGQVIFVLFSTQSSNEGQLELMV